LSRKKERGQAGEAELARDELFSHIHRCGVLKATEEQQGEWMDDTIDYLAERYPSLEQSELDDLKAIGLRFCRPVIANRPPESADVDTTAEIGEQAEAEAEVDGEDAEVAVA
jgi:hypothetical protein